MNAAYIDYLVHHWSLEELIDFYNVSHVFGKEIAKYFDSRTKEDLRRLSPQKIVGG